MPEKYDFSGWATRNDVKCSDGRTIKRNAFKDQNGKTVPLVWMHQHNAPENVLGHAILENRPEGVYAYCTFNDTESGQIGKQLVAHKDIVGLSIYANQLKQSPAKEVVHGLIREVSLVIAGANPGATIDAVIAHGDVIEDALVLELNLEHSEYSLDYEEGEVELVPLIEEEEEADEVEVAEESADAEESDEPVEEDVEHSDELEEVESEEPEAEVTEESENENEEESTIEHADSEEGESKMAEKTVKEVFDTLTEEQKTVVYALIGQAIEDAKAGADEGDEEDMKHNVFDTEEMNSGNVLSHADMQQIMINGKRIGSLKDAYNEYVDENFLQHADDEPVYPVAGVDYGVGGLDNLFPDAQRVGAPFMLKRSDDWVSVIMNGAKHTPFARIKSLYADITADDARAKGYLKGHEKHDEVFPLFKRITTPTTVYKKQKLDRDDIIDIDFDVIPWIKSEMRVLLNEEIARAALVGDGRSLASEDKINPLNIRPIYTDTENQVYAFNVPVTPGADDDATAKAFIRAAIKGRKDYRGSGKPILFCTEEMLTNMLLLEDGVGRALYETEDALATKLRVSKIISVPVMDNQVRSNVSGYDYTLAGIIVNPADYCFGADKGGAVSLFDDFDIDFNQMKYLIETRCSGALIVPKSAMILELKTAHSNG